MALPFRFLSLLLLAACTAFALGPWWTMRSIAQAADERDEAQWHALVRTDHLQTYAGKLLEAMLDLRMYADMKNDTREALRDNSDGKRLVESTARLLAGPQGFRHLLCGELTDDPNGEAQGQAGCWALDGSVRWESPIKARVSFTNPGTLWQSELVLLRIGLFQWQAIAVDLPAGAILDRFSRSVGLEPKPMV